MVPLRKKYESMVLQSSVKEKGPYIIEPYYRSHIDPLKEPFKGTPKRREVRHQNKKETGSDGA